MKKLCSQYFSSFFEKESITVTTRFFTFFAEGHGRFGFLDIYKCPKSVCDHQTQNRFFFIFFHIFIKEQILYIGHHI